jgi:hypothetical protein
MLLQEGKARARPRRLRTPNCRRRGQREPEKESPVCSGQNTGNDGDTLRETGHSRRLVGCDDITTPDYPGIARLFPE